MKFFERGYSASSYIMYIQGVCCKKKAHCHFFFFFFLSSVELNNNHSSLNSSMRSVGLLDGFAGAVQGLQTSMITNQSVNLHWNPPAVSNGNIVAYSVYVNDSVVSIGLFSQQQFFYYVLF